MPVPPARACSASYGSLPAIGELERARIGCARDLAEAAIGCRRANEDCEPLERLAEALPYDEVIHERLITLYGHVGRRADGLRHCELIRRRLADDLGMDPDVGLRRAHLALLGDDLPEPGPPPAPVCLLPADLPDFTGREEEVERLTALLGQAKADTGAVPMVAISGMPRVGKTTLAIHASHRLRAQFPDGQLFADLHGTDGRPADPGHVLGRWLRVLGEEPARIPDSLEGRAELMRARHDRMGWLRGHHARRGSRSVGRCADRQRQAQR